MPIPANYYYSTYIPGTPNAVMNKLNQAAVPIVVQQGCNLSYNGGITNNMICAGLPDGEKIHAQ